MQNLRKQNEREVEALQTVMVRQLKKNVDIAKMPSVRVRPTLRVELKHRIMNCKLPNRLDQEDDMLDMNSLNDKVLQAMQNRSNIGGFATQSELLEQTH